jgi:plastocyanin
MMRTALLAAMLAAVPLTALGEEPMVYRLSARDGSFDPQTIEVPAGKRFRLEVSNAGKGPMEFESRDLKQEKVIAGGARATLTIGALKPGTYVFFDEHHPGAEKGRIVAK